jgi:hypothetical protein
MRPKRDKLLINMTLMGVCIAMLLSVGVSMSFGQSDTQNRQKELAEHQFLFEYIYFKVDKTAMLPSSSGNKPLNPRTLEPSNPFSPNGLGENPHM